MYEILCKIENIGQTIVMVYTLVNKTNFPKHNRIIYKYLKLICTSWTKI